MTLCVRYVLHTPLLWTYQFALKDAKRRLLFNLYLTLVSAAVAASVALVEVLGCLQAELELEGPFWKVQTSISAPCGVPLPLSGVDYRHLPFPTVTYCRHPLSPSITYHSLPLPTVTRCSPRSTLTSSTWATPSSASSPSRSQARPQPEPQPVARPVACVVAVAVAEARAVAIAVAVAVAEHARAVFLTSRSPSQARSCSSSVLSRQTRRPGRTTSSPAACSSMRPMWHRALVT